MKFVQAIMSQQRLVSFLMYCACNSGIVKHMVPLTWLQTVMASVRKSGVWASIKSVLHTVNSNYNTFTLVEVPLPFFFLNSFSSVDVCKCNLEKKQATSIYMKQQMIVSHLNKIEKSHY